MNPLIGADATFNQVLAAKDLGPYQGHHDGVIDVVIGPIAAGNDF